MTINHPTATRRLIVPVVLIGLAATTAVALATPPGINGRIAFRRYADVAKSSGAVFTINPDGSDLSQVTHPPAGNVDDQPNWTPDGKRLVFCRINPKRSCAITVVNADGTGLRRLTRPCDALPPKCVDRYQPSFAPDGQHIVYTRTYGKLRHFNAGTEVKYSSVATMDLDGHGEHAIYRVPAWAGIEFAQASPDGRRVVFERVNPHTGKHKFGRAVFVVGVDGSGIRQLTPWNLAAGNAADWAPHGSRILFRSNPGFDERHSQYYTVRPDGTQLTRLTDFAVGTKLFKATYSPDGTQIVFGQGDAQRQGDVWAMNADGTNQHPILQEAPWDSAAAWGPAAG